MMRLSRFLTRTNWKRMKLRPTRVLQRRFANISEAEWKQGELFFQNVKEKIRVLEDESQSLRNSLMASFSEKTDLEAKLKVRCNFINT